MRGSTSRTWRCCMPGELAADAELLLEHGRWPTAYPNGIKRLQAKARRITRADRRPASTPFSARGAATARPAYRHVRQFHARVDPAEILQQIPIDAPLERDLPITGARPALRQRRAGGVRRRVLASGHPSELYFCTGTRAVSWSFMRFVLVRCCAPVICGNSCVAMNHTIANPVSHCFK